MRELMREEMRWVIREVSTEHVPGARAGRCLIFESEGVVRRVWTFPDDWRRLSDDATWALLTVAPPSRHEQESSVRPPSSGEPGHPAIDAAGMVANRARSLLAEVATIRDTNHSLRSERRELVGRCRALRREMRDAITQYAQSLRRSDVPPERVLVLIKAAMNAGLAGARCDEPVAEELLNEGVEWCIEAYYGAGPYQTPSGDFPTGTVHFTA
jgi:hypothetical protein